ncbi:hypothetical protein PIB30_099794 [Stylosanthes scabra]|uniref:Uncharacterized protein n=1 Tax=Stylosanthes scabra TaxID=79078 RepID=A0ABU6ZVJ6_9FABA|nr:hypothetical protein [Stylosanthes scabra]
MAPFLSGVNKEHQAELQQNKEAIWRYKGRICVPDVGSLRKDILSEVSKNCSGTRCDLGKLNKGSLQIKKRNLEAKQSKAPRICVDEHAYACCSYPNPRLSQPTTLRRGNLLDQSHASPCVRDTSMPAVIPGFVMKESGGLILQVFPNEGF